MGLGEDRRRSGGGLTYRRGNLSFTSDDGEVAVSAALNTVDIDTVFAEIPPE